MNALSVWMNGERVATWTLRSGTHTLRYEPSWLVSERRRSLSLSLPIGPSLTITGAVVKSYFDNLLPDNDDIRERLRRRYGAASREAFDLLTAIGRDCVGAVQLLPDDAETPDVRRLEHTPLGEAAVEAHLDAMLTGAPLGSAEQDDGGFRISIAGAQEKSALLRIGKRWCMPHGATPTTHILKLPLGLVGGMQYDASRRRTSARPPASRRARNMRPIVARASMPACACSAAAPRRTATAPSSCCRSWPSGC